MWPVPLPPFLPPSLPSSLPPSLPPSLFCMHCPGLTAIVAQIPSIDQFRWPGYLILLHAVVLAVVVVLLFQEKKEDLYRGGGSCSLRKTPIPIYVSPVQTRCEYTLCNSKSPVARDLWCTGKPSKSEGGSLRTRTGFRLVLDHKSICMATGLFLIPHVIGCMHGNYVTHVTH